MDRTLEMILDELSRLKVNNFILENENESLNEEVEKLKKALDEKDDF